MMRKYLVWENAWPFLFLLLFGLYMEIERVMWLLTMFFTLSLLFFSLMLSRLIDYFYVQRRITTMLFAITNLLFGVAIIFQGIANYPYADLSHFRNYSRLTWAISLPVFALGVWFHSWWVYRRFKERIDHTYNRPA